MTSLLQQVDQEGKLRHLLSIEGLSTHLIHQILDLGQHFVELNRKKSPYPTLLKGMSVANLFFEPSTRTRTTFELAAKNLGANVVNFNIYTSATSKGESLFDTLRNLEAMQCDLFVVRHQASGAAHFIADHVQPHVSVINGGDGCHAHPTQALLDMLTIRQVKKDFAGLKVAIVGDILHSRVARSEITALQMLGVEEIRVVAPKTLLPPNIEALGVHVYHDLAAGLADVDVVTALRLQKERMNQALLPSEEEYFRMYGITEEKLAHAAPDAIVMHPGPINRGVEISSTLADGPRSVILQQVTNGIAVRMAIMTMAMDRGGINQ